MCFKYVSFRNESPSSHIAQGRWRKQWRPSVSSHISLGRCPWPPSSERLTQASVSGSCSVSSTSVKQGQL